MNSEAQAKQQITPDEASRAAAQAENDAKAKAQAVEAQKKEKAVFERIVKKRNEKKRLSEVEKTILELAATYDAAHQDEKDIYHALLNTLVREDEAKAAERRQARERKKLIKDKLDKLHDTRARHKANNALHVANNLYRLGILNNDASYKIPAEIFYSFIKANLHLLNQPVEQAEAPKTPPKPNLEQVPQPTTGTTPVAHQQPTQQALMQPPEPVIAPPTPAPQNSQQQPSSQSPNTSAHRQKENNNPR